MSGKPSHTLTVTAGISSVFMDITFVLIRLWRLVGCILICFNVTARCC